MIKELNAYNELILDLAEKGYRDFDIDDLPSNERTSLIVSVLNLKIKKLKAIYARQQREGDEHGMASSLFTLETLGQHLFLVRENDNKLIKRYSMIYNDKINGDVNSMLEEINCEREATNRHVWDDDDSTELAV